MANDEFIAQTVDLLGIDDSVKGEQEMNKMIELLESDEVGGQLDPSGRALAVQALMSTNDRVLLEAFASSNALSRLEKWLAESHAAAKHEDTQQLLSLLGHVPVSVQALMSSGVGKTVNKVRKDEAAAHNAVAAAAQSAAAELLRSWKALADQSGSAAVPKAASSVSKRQALGSADGDAKRAKAVPLAKVMSNEADVGLDAALLGAGAPRKASLKLEPARPKKAVPLSQPGANLAKAASSASSNFASALPPIRVPSPTLPARADPSHRTAHPSDEQGPALTAICKVARKPPSFKRVSWRSATELVETREYIVEDKKGATTSWSDLMQQEREREREAVHKRLADESDPWAIGAGEASVAAPSAAAHVAPPAEAQVAPPAQQQPPPAALKSSSPPLRHVEPTIAWYTPAVLDDRYWPVIKGDESTEREAQRQRRLTRMEMLFRRTQDLKGGPAPPPPEPDSGPSPFTIPFDQPAEPSRVQPAPVPPPPPPAQQAAAPPAAVTSHDFGGMGMEGAVRGGAQPVLSQQQQQQLMMQRLGGMSGGMLGGCMSGGTNGSMAGAFGAGLSGSGLGIAANGLGGGGGVSGGGGGSLTDKLMMQMQLKQSANAVSLFPHNALHCCSLFPGRNPSV